MKLTVRGVAILVALFATAILATDMTLVRVIAVEREVPARNKEAVLSCEQNPKEQIARPLNQVPMECEGAAARLDFAVIETKKLDGAYLIIIARLGTGEVSSRLNQIRLAVAEEYVLRRGTDFKYVLAQGEKVKGLGRLELYVGGQLYEILPLQRNAKGFCLPGQK